MFLKFLSILVIFLTCKIFLFLNLQAQTDSISHDNRLNIRLEKKQKSSSNINYIKVNEEVLFSNPEKINLYVYRFKHIFYFPPPPYVESNQLAKKNIDFDSLFTISTNEYVRFLKPELYFVQKDTINTIGFSFRVVDQSFPSLKKINDIIDPLIYVSNNQEKQALVHSKNKKKELDNFLWQMSKGDLEKARYFMKSFFQRVRYANENYTTFKAGWKTDKGMIYIVFGKPLNIILKEKKEIWIYGTSLQFTFLKTKTILSDNHYTLLRNKRYRSLWFKKIHDLRNGVF